jgi:methylmalonyl-CoA carboxyltransferase small subunit
LKLHITVDNKTYEVDVEVAEDDHAPSGPVPYYAPRSGAAAPVVLPSAAGPAAPPAGPSAAVDEQKVCRSPVSGIVVRINAQVGQQIQTNDVLLVLEAMKMETNVTSPVSGAVKAIHPNMGDGVQIGQVLVEFE